MRDMPKGETRANGDNIGANPINVIERSKRVRCNLFAFCNDWRIIPRMSALAITHKDSILERIAKGDKLVEIAADLGISQPAISKVLANDPDYLEAREYGALSRLEAREKEMEAIDAAASPVILGRARELLSHARWYAEREFPHRWGQHNKLTVENVGDLGDRLRRAKERTVQGQRVDAVAELPNVAPLQPDSSDSDNSE